MALVVKSFPADTGDMGDTSSIPGSGRSPGGGCGNPLQYSCLENPMDTGAWWATIHGVTESNTTEQLTLPLPLSLWAKSVTDVGKIHSKPPNKIQIDPQIEPFPRINQYSISKKPSRHKSIIEDYKAQGLIFPCTLIAPAYFPYYR